jgi:HK97 family phage major capsid protein
MPDTTVVDVPALTEQAAGLRDACLASVTRVQELRSTPADKRGETFAGDVRSAIDDLHANDAMHQAVTRILRAAADEDARSRGRGNGPTAATGAHTGEGPDLRSLGQRVADDEGYKTFAERGGRGLAEVEVRTTITTGAATTDAGIFMPRGTPFLLSAAVDQRRAFVRDLLSTGTTGLNSVPYIRELNPRTNETGATTVAEGAPKPEVQMEFTQKDAPARKIAAWIPATTEILADAPTLRSYIDARLAYMLMLREEDQVLNGDGTAPNLTGIRQQTGLLTVKATGGTATSVVGDSLTNIALGIQSVELVDGEPDGLVINPTDFWTMATRRAGGGTTGDNHYDLDPFKGPEALKPWGLNTVRTRAVPALTALVGAWKIGATLLDREQTVIRVGDQHSDFFTNNKVAILAEERVALPVHRPDFFCEVTFR